jgi:hypothetical protein
MLEIPAVPFAKLGKYALWLFHCEIFAFSMESLPFFRGLEIGKRLRQRSPASIQLSATSDDRQ